MAGGGRSGVGKVMGQFWHCRAPAPQKAEALDRSCGAASCINHQGEPHAPSLDIADDVLFALLERSASLLQAAHMLGAGTWRRVLLIALPMARPAIMAGVSLALMETLADYGIHPLPPRGVVVSNELIDRLRDEEGI